MRPSLAVYPPLKQRTACTQEQTHIDQQQYLTARSLWSLRWALVAWSGGLGLLYDELQLRFPHAAAIGISARLAAIRPFPFASGCATMTICVATAAASASSALVIESVVLGVHNATNVLVRTLSFPIILLDRLASPCLSSVDLSSLPPLRTIGASALRKCESLQSISLVNLPLLENIGDYAFAECARLSSVDLFDLSALRSIGNGSFDDCISLQSISLANLPLLENIGCCAFAECARLSNVNLSDLPALRTIGEGAFRFCESLQTVSLANLPLLESIGSGAFAYCASLQCEPLRTPIAYNRGKRLRELHISSIDQPREPATSREHWRLRFH